MRHQPIYFAGKAALGGIPDSQWFEMIKEVGFSQSVRSIEALYSLTIGKSQFLQNHLDPFEIGNHLFAWTLTFEVQEELLGFMHYIQVLFGSKGFKIFSLKREQWSDHETGSKGETNKQSAYTHHTTRRTPRAP